MRSKTALVNKKAGQSRKATDLLFYSGAPGRIRTADTGFRRAVLYPLSYEGMGD